MNKGRLKALKYIRKVVLSANDRGKSSVCIEMCEDKLEKAGVDSESLAFVLGHLGDVKVRKLTLDRDVYLLYW